MTGLIERWLRRRAIRRYLTRLPRRLFEDYGHAGPYTPAQVEATLRRHKAGPLRHAAYAVAIFCDPKLPSFDPDHGPDYGAMRAEVGNAFFDGDSGFTLREVGGYGGMSESTGHAGESGGGGHHGGHGDGGGHHA
jgi:hypothetical protein